MRGVLVTLLVAAACAGCGRVAEVAPSAVAPASPVAASQAPTASASPATPATSLVLTGVIAATVDRPAAEAPCGALPNGFTSDLRFSYQGRPYSLTLTLPDYRGPGSYPAPPARVSVHTVGFGGGDPVFLSGIAGTVVVNPDGLSGTVEEDLRSDRGTAHVSGSWRC